MHWYWKTIAYQFWFFKLKQYFRYLDLNHIFIHLQVAPSVANFVKHTDFFVNCLKASSELTESEGNTLLHLHLKWYFLTCFCLISQLMTEHHSCFGSVNKKSKIYRALTIYVHINCIICFNEEEKINFKMSWIPEADSKIFVQKRGFRKPF